MVAATCINQSINQSTTTSQSLFEQLPACFESIIDMEMDVPSLIMVISDIIHRWQIKDTNHLLQTASLPPSEYFYAESYPHLQ